MATREKEPQARIAINKPAWRIIAIASVIVILSLVAALISQVSLSEAGSESDPLTTLALVLAVLAFLIQIFVFVFQSKMSTDAVLRSEDLNLQTRSVLEKIEANSAATQRVLFAQFDRLLNFIVGGKTTPSKERDRVRAVLDTEHGADGSDSEPVSKSDLTELLGEVVARATERPSFSAEDSIASPEDLEMVEFLRSWPSKTEGELWVSRLVRLSPLAVATLVRFGSAEVLQRLRGEDVGLRIAVEDMDAATQELIDHGLVREIEPRFRLTDEGRAAWRVLPFMKEESSPEWLADALSPLLQPIEAPVVK